jgi:hypothetical protein
MGSVMGRALVRAAAAGYCTPSSVQYRSVVHSPCTIDADEVEDARYGNASLLRDYPCGAVAEPEAGARQEASELPMRVKGGATPGVARTELVPDAPPPEDQGLGDEVSQASAGGASEYSGILLELRALQRQASRRPSALSLRSTTSHAADVSDARGASDTTN